MSQENVEKVRAGFAAYNRGDLEAVMESHHPDVEFVTLLLGTHHGTTALRRLFEENRNTLSGYKLEPEELIDAGDQVIAVVHLGGAGRLSEIALDDRIAFLITLKDGLMIRQQTFRTQGRSPRSRRAVGVGDVAGERGGGQAVARGIPHR